MEREDNTSKVVLLIDDDQFLRDMYALKFRERGFTVETSEGGSDALERLRGGLAPSIILFDIVMPGLDGFEFLARLKEERLAEGSVAIALSNEGQGADVEKATSLGAHGYIIKANTIPSEVVDKVIALASK